MSQDRRPITDGEMIGLFEFYLRKWCEEHEGEDTVVITNSDGKKIFEAVSVEYFACHKSYILHHTSYLRLSP